MSQQEVIFEAYFQAPPEKVFAIFADHERFGRVWGAKFKRIKDGQGDPNGLGSVRDIHMGLLHFEETIKTFEPSSLIEYTVSAGKALIHNHLGRIEFRAENGGTRLNYRIQFEPDIPLTGGLVAAIMRNSFKPARVTELLSGR